MESLELTEREGQELEWCLRYDMGDRWGTDGHNRMILVAKLAKQLGFYIGDDGALEYAPRIDMYGERLVKDFDDPQDTARE